MMLTSDALNGIMAALSYRQSAAQCAAHRGHIGLLPGHENKVRGVFVRDTVEVTVSDLVAQLASGQLISVDETAAIKVPMLYGEVYYLTVGTGDSVVHFESNGVPFVRPSYSYAISTFDEMKSAGTFPLLRFSVKDGVFSIDENFIRPCLYADCDERIGEYVARLTEAMQVVADHPNGDRQLLRGCLFRIKAQRRDMPLSDMMLRLAEAAQAIDYVVMNSDEAEVQEEVMEWSLYDVQAWFEWFGRYLERARTVLDGIVIEEEKIDLEAIKQELREEIYDHIKPDLEQMVNDRVDNLSEVLQGRIEEALKDYVNGTVLSELHDRLHSELESDLSDVLYADLYQALYSALYVPEEEVIDTFVPLM